MRPRLPTVAAALFALVVTRPATVGEVVTLPPYIVAERREGPAELLIGSWRCHRQLLVASATVWLQFRRDGTFAMAMEGRTGLAQHERHASGRWRLYRDQLRLSIERTAGASPRQRLLWMNLERITSAALTLAPEVSQPALHLQRIAELPARHANQLAALGVR